MIDLLQNTLDGLTLGASYALLAVGFTLIFGVLRRANLSYGPAIMFGAYLATWASLNFQLGLIVLAAIVILGSVLAGAYVERLCFAPHRAGSAAAAMVASFALWMQLEELGPLRFGAFYLRVESLAMLLAAIVVCAALWALLYRSRFGIAVRAVIDNPRAAELSGVNLAKTSIFVFALASSIGGVAGFLIVSSHEQVTPMLGMWSTLMLGGLGSLPGAVAGGLALGLIEAHSQWYLGPQFRDFVSYLLLFVLLSLRPPWMNTRSGY